MNLRSLSLRLLAIAGSSAFLVSANVPAGAATRIIMQHPVAASHVVFHLSGYVGDSTHGFGVDTKFCKTFPNVCVEQGGKKTLGIQLNCTSGGSPVSCGNVTWSATTSTSMLTATFSPNPSPGPNGTTTETVKSAKGEAPTKGASQTISWTCDGISNCAGSATGLPIHVTR